MIAAIILAAGGSTRFGSPKQLIDVAGENIVARAARAAMEAGCDPVIVVTGNAAETFRLPEKVEIVFNDQWRSGQASSIKAGVERASATECVAAVVMLADQPLIDSVMLRDLIAAFDNEHQLVAASYGGTVGAPAIFGRKYFAELMKLTGDRGAGSWIRERLDIASIVPMPAAAIDIDTESDLSRVSRGRRVPS